MVPLIKADIRKLLTVRSTYVLLGIAAALIGFISFWMYGYKAVPGDSGIIIGAMDNGASTISLFLAIAAILLMTHEYRFNTILYTLTASNSRNKVLASKVLVVLGFSVVVTLLAAVWGVIAAWIGWSVQGLSLSSQEIPLWDHLWRNMFGSLAWVMFGLLFAVLFRNVVGAIITLFIVPSTIESLLGLLLKENVKYLPFSSLDQVINVSSNGLTPGSAAIVVSIYLAVGWAVGWWLFRERDAN